VGQLADEPDGVGDQHRLAARELEPAGGGVEGGEQAVLDQHSGVGEPVEQRRLAGVGVADDRHLPALARLAGLALVVADRRDGAQVGLELVDRRTMRRRSTSSWVSPGPRRAPMPPPAG
jgi:hypothetical protein